MKIAEIKEAIAHLGVKPNELAELIDVNPRTVTRWLSGEVRVPNVVERLVQAWLTLHQFGMPWRPDGKNLLVDQHQRQQIKLQIENSLELSTILERIEAKGGPAAPWTVDIKQKRATLDSIWVSFYITVNGGFTPQSYGRTDKSVDLDRDRVLIDDAYYCIAIEIGKYFKKQQQANWIQIET